MVKGVPLSLREVGVDVVPKPKVFPVCMPSFLFVELSRYHLRYLHHRGKELILTPTGQLPRLFKIRHDLTV